MRWHVFKITSPVVLIQLAPPPDLQLFILGKLSWGEEKCLNAWPLRASVVTGAEGGFFSFFPVGAKLCFKHHPSLLQLPSVLFVLLAVKSTAVGFRTPSLAIWTLFVSAAVGVSPAAEQQSEQAGGRGRFFFYFFLQLVVGEKRKEGERRKSVARKKKTTPRGALIAISTSITLAQQRQGEWAV